jgi:tRNA threonylcarbamoyladenosine biosynthesis protein TsaB
MRVLAVDTTAAFGSIAIAQDSDIVEEIPLHSPEGFSQVLFDHVRRLLDRHGWTVRDVQCFAAASGPGSFTGVRVGLAAVKALAEATGVLAAAVSNLQALATFGSTGRRAVVMDARRGEIYGAVYDASLAPIAPEVVMPFSEWLRLIDPLTREFISPDLAPFRLSLPSDAVCIEQRVIAGAVARIARGGDPATLDANYVRRSDAELLWRDR